MALSKNIRLRNIKEAALNQKELKRQLYYNQHTGIFTWLVSNSNCIKIGDIAGCKQNIYFEIRIKTLIYKIHRLAFLYMTGIWPIYEVDHINHDSLDNRWCNLRPATHQENHKNTSIRSDNISRYTGVHWHKNRNKWTAYITINGVKKHLGYFINKIDAIEKRKKASTKYNFHPNHGE